MAIRNILTVDVEDWYHICDIEHILPSSRWDQCESRVLVNIEKILSLLSRFRVKATFFILGYVAERTPEVLAMIHREGHEIASHGYGHVQVYKQNPETFLQDLIRSKALVERVIGEKVIGYRAPEWSICGAPPLNTQFPQVLQQAEPAEANPAWIELHTTPPTMSSSSPIKKWFSAKAGGGKRDSYWAVDLLVQQGFLYDSSIAPLRFIGTPDAPTTPYTLSTSRGKIKEFPPLVMGSPLGNIPIGGGWGLRIFPYRTIRGTIEQKNREDQPVLIFCHPTDFDPSPPELNLPWIKRFVCRGKIKTTEERLMRLLSDFEFASIREFVFKESGRDP
jgi:peptidoglycan/xylan/chitin deacetylase (PgdA/CDA1 family)